MRVSRNWLNQYVSISLGDAELAERLTMAGLEVESIESQAEALRGLLVGVVLSVSPHPDATRLTVCKVGDGKGEVQVVCGAPNVAPGQKVAFAPEGSTVPRNQHDPEGGPLTIGRVRVRGVESAGMICSLYELGISDDRSGILVLGPGARPGTPLARELGRDDTTLEIGVTANRPDLLSHIGVAREIGALTGKPLRLPSTSVRETGKGVGSLLMVTIEDRSGCPRYVARVVEGVSVGESPGWLRRALLSVNVRPVNNVVDVTNYVLMEIGQPLHAFDHALVKGGEIVIRRAGSRSAFTTLDGKERELLEDTLMICDGSGPIAIAGVMGGRNSEINDGTRTVVIESAYFDPASIRRTSKRLGLSTEASQRFERGADPLAAAWAADRAAALIAEVAGGSVLRGKIDRFPGRIKPRTVRLNIQKSNELLGITLDKSTVSSLFRRIGITPVGRSTNDVATYRIPTWRPDVTRAVDLIEEAARLHGYDRIPAATDLRFAPGERPLLPSLTDTLREYLSSAGFREVVTNSMTDMERAEHPERKPVRITNPISSDMAVLRTSLLPGVLDVVRHNRFHGIDSSRFYEFGNVFGRKEGGDPESLTSYEEEERLLILAYGLESPVHWGENVKNVSLFTLKGEANALLRRISLDNTRYIPYPTATALSERSLRIEIQGQTVGSLGQVSGGLLKRHEIDTDVFFIDLSIDVIRKSSPAGIRFTPYPRYPTVKRDLAVVVPESVAIGRIEEEIRNSAGPLLREITLFDVYRGNQAGEGKKSCAFSLEFVPGDRTLEQREILEIMERVTGRLTTSLGAEPRQ